MEEIWKDIIWYEWIYKISNLWRIKSLWNIFNRKEKILKTYTDYKWYDSIWLYKNWLFKKYKIHRLVAKAFIPNPYNKSEVNHINHIRNDNRMENLEWCTTAENARHKKKNHILLANKFNYIIQKYDLNWNVIKSYNNINEIIIELWINTIDNWYYYK